MKVIEGDDILLCPYAYGFLAVCGYHSASMVTTSPLFGVFGHHLYFPIKTQPKSNNGHVNEVYVTIPLKITAQRSAALYHFQLIPQP
jgi:hypothetical protein